MSTSHSYKFVQKEHSLPTVDDKCSFTRARNVLTLLITSFERLESPSYCYNISNNGKGKGSLCELFQVKDYVFNLI